jgi:hypothetical protein
VYLAAQGAEAIGTSTLLPFESASREQGLRVEVVHAPPAVVAEGAAFKQEVVVRVSNSLTGQGVAGKYVIAMQSMAAGATAFGYLSAFESIALTGGEHDGAKRLLHPISTGTNSTGYARFLELGFGAGGYVGAYELQFLCEGSASGVNAVQVTSRVARVSAIGLNPIDSFGFSGETNILSPQPVIFVADAHGQGIAGKVVSVFLLSEPRSSPSLQSPRASISWGGPVVTDESGYARFVDLLMASASPLSSMDLRFSVDGVVSANGQSVFFTSFPDFFRPSSSECGRIDLDNGKLITPTAATAKSARARTASLVNGGAEVLSWAISSAKWPRFNGTGLNLSVSFRVYNRYGVAISATQLQEAKKFVRVQAINNMYARRPGGWHMPTVELLPRSPFRLENSDLVTIASDGLITITGLRAVGYPSSFIVRLAVGSILSDDGVVLDVNSLSSIATIGKWHWQEECSAGDGLSSEAVLTSTLALSEQADSPPQVTTVELVAAGTSSAGVLSPPTEVMAGVEILGVVVRVVDQHGRGIPHTMAQLFVQRGPAALSALLPGTTAVDGTHEYCNGTLMVEAAVAAIEAIRVDTLSSVCAVPPRTETALVDSRFTGLSALTNESGFANFHGLHFAASASGAFTVLAESDGIYSPSDASPVRFDVFPAVASIQLLKGAACGTSTITPVASPINSTCLPEIILRDSSAAPMPQQWVTLRAVTTSAADTGVRTALAWSPLTFYSFTPTVPEGSVIARSDDTGRVRFEGLMFSGAASGCYRLSFTHFTAGAEGASLTTNSSTVWCVEQQVELVKQITDSSSFPVVSSGVPMASPLEVAVRMQASSTHSHADVWCRAWPYVGTGSTGAESAIVLGGAVAMTSAEGVAIFDNLTIGSGVDGSGLTAGDYLIYWECQVLDI